MSRRSSLKYRQDVLAGYPAADVQYADAEAYPRTTARRADSGATARLWSGYTLTHAGRQLRLGPVAFWVVVGTLVIMGVWTITTATYFAFREDVLTRLIARQADMQFGYEDRIAEMRAQVDRISSGQLLDQEQYEEKLEQILRRQTALESRTNALNGLNDVTSSIRSPARGSTSAGSGPQLRPSPVNGKGALLLPRQSDVLDARKAIAK